MLYYGRTLFIAGWLTLPPNSAKRQYSCHQCGRNYSWPDSLNRHKKYECGKEAQFGCPHCKYRAKLHDNLIKHIRRIHKNIEQQ